MGESNVQEGSVGRGTEENKRTRRERLRILGSGGDSRLGSRQRDSESTTIHTIEEGRHTPALLLTSCKMRGLRVTMPDPRGRKSLSTDRGGGQTTF